MKKLILIGVITIMLACGIGVALYKAHPIILKWVSGDARVIGKSLNATVYTNGHINTDITVYEEKTYWNGGKADRYILNLKKFDKDWMLRFINIDLTEKRIGRPVSTNEADYDLINGYLFQSDVSYLSTDFRDDMKGFNFDPHLEFNKKEIKFSVPPNYLKFDSVRIELK